MNVEILYQDKDLIAAYKPSGLLIHSYKEKCGEQDTMLRRLRDLSGHYLYPIHRIDRPVSGIVLFGLNSEIVKKMKAIWHGTEFIKEYTALCKGIISEEGIFDFPLKNDNGQIQEACTRYWPLEQFKELSLVKVTIDTGRKHQIRRHFARRSFNLVGDVKHGRGSINRHFREIFGFNRIFLHASRLSFIHPETEQKVEINSPLPNDLQELLTRLRNK